jgi:uncharacterized protein
MGMSRIYWDTNLFIYLFEDFGSLSQSVIDLRKRMLVRKDELYTSVLTLGELLVKPLEKSEEHLAAEFKRRLLSTASLTPFDQRAAQIYGMIRRDRSLRPPDAIHLACAASVGIDLFITNDSKLMKKDIPGIHFITPLTMVPL